MTKISLLFAMIGTLFISGTTDVVYNGGTLNQVVVTAKREVPETLRQYHKLLAQLVHSEAGHESNDGKRAVADVVQNIARFKGITIEQAIYLPGIFDGIKHPVFKIEPTEACYEAARLSLLGDKLLPDGVLFFYNPRAASDSKWIQHISNYKYKQIGNHVFCWEPTLYAKTKKSLKKKC